MFRKIGYWFHTLKCDSKSAFSRLKWHFYLLLGALVIALLVAIAADYGDAEVNGDFFCLIADGEGFPVRSAIWTAFAISLSFAVLIVSCTNFYLFFVGYLAFGISAYHFLFTAVTAIFCDGLWGIVYILLFLLPLFLVWLYAYAMALYRIYRNIIAGTGRCFRNLLRCNLRSVCRVLLPFWALTLGFAAILWLSESFILVLIF